MRFKLNLIYEFGIVFSQSSSRIAAGAVYVYDNHRRVPMHSHFIWVCCAWEMDCLLNIDWPVSMSMFMLTLVLAEVKVAPCIV